MIALAGSGCGDAQTPDSGILGTVTIGPLNPVSQPGQIDSKPYSATIDIRTIPEGELIATVISDEQGKFRVALEPGTYLVEPQSNGQLPFAETQEVAVSEGRFVEVKIDYDSGIR